MSVSLLGLEEALPGQRQGWTERVPGRRTRTRTKAEGEALKSGEQERKEVFSGGGERELKVEETTALPLPPTQPGD